MKTYRDGQVAHYDFSAEPKIPYYPVLYLALELSYLYYRRTIMLNGNWVFAQYPDALY